MKKIIEFIRNLPEYVILLIVWLLLGPGAVLLYQTVWNNSGSQKVAYIGLGPLALSTGLICALALYIYYKDRD